MVRLLGENGVEALARRIVALCIHVLLRVLQQLALAPFALDREQAGRGALVLCIHLQHRQERLARTIGLAGRGQALGLLQAAAGGAVALLQVGAAVLRVAGIMPQGFLQFLQAGRHLVLRDQFASVTIRHLPGAASEQQWQHQQGGVGEKTVHHSSTPMLIC